MTNVEFRVLGRVALYRNGRLANLGGPTTLTVLAALLLSANHAVPMERLTEIVWGDNPPARPHPALHSAVSRLRRAVGPGLIESSTRAYRLRASPNQLDLLRSQDLAGAAASAQARGDIEAAANALTEAIGLWQMPVLSNVDSLALHGQATRLTELYLSMQESRAELFGRLGRHAAAAELLTPLVREHPFHERLVGQLMLALVRSGRQADALAAYESLRSTLATELGIDPSPWPQELHVRILRADPDLDAPSAAVAQAAAGAGAVAGGALPPAITDAGGSGRSRWRGRRPATGGLIGRDDDIHSLAAAVMSGRVVTVTGPAGVGKTSVALATASQLARSLTDGVAVAELGTLPAHQPCAGDAGWRKSGDDVADAVRLALGACGAPGQAADDVLTAHLASMELLLVLDNAEHVAAAAGSVADLVVRSCPQVRVLAASRRSLGVDGEVVVELAPLRPAQTAELLLSRAASHRPAPDLGADQAAVAELCRVLDGLPLAVELAAARLRAMPVSTLLERIKRWPGVLAAQTSPRLPHQRALDATLRWSYDLLTRQSAALLGRLAVFAGTFTLEDAERVCGFGAVPERDVARLLSGLVDDSLVQVVRDHDQYSYRLLVPVREFALGNVPAADMTATRARHLRHMYQAVADAGAAYPGGPGGEGALAAALESGFSDLLAFADLPPACSHSVFADLLAAWEWALQDGGECSQAEAGARLLLVSRTAWESLPGAASSVLRHVMRALALPSLPAPLVAHLTLLAGNLHYRLGDPAQARHLLERALELLERAGANDPRASVAALSDLALIAYSQAAPDAADVIHACAARARQSHDRKIVAVTLAKAAHMLARLGHSGEAGRLIAEAVAAAGDDPALRRHCLPRRSAVLLRAGRVAEARRDAEQALAMLGGATSYERVSALLAHGWAQAAGGDTAAARDTLAAGAALAEDRQVLVLLPGYFLAQAYLGSAEGRPADAVPLVCRTIRLALSHHDLVTVIAALHLAAVLAQDCGSPHARRIAVAVRECRICSGLPTWPFTAGAYARYESELKLDSVLLPVGELTPGMVASVAGLALEHLEAPSVPGAVTG